jgi:hypothetical protein
MSNDVNASDFDAAMRQHAASRAAERARTLEEHDAHLRQYGTGDADYMARHRYMQEHGLEYRDGPDGRRVLVWAPSTVFREAAYDAQRRVAQDPTYFSGAILGSATGGVAPPMPAPVPTSEQVGGGVLDAMRLQRFHEEQMRGGIAQMPRHPDKMFSRETICSVLKAEKVRAGYPTPATDEQCRVANAKTAMLDGLIHIFENLE